VDPVTVSILIARPPEEVFDYLADIANHAEFSDHYLTRWHLTREDSYGTGAGARFHAEAPLSRFSWADVTITELQRPHRIVELGRGGKFNRIRTTTIYSLRPGAGGGTEVELTADTEPVTLGDRIVESFGTRRWFKRNSRKALRRLRSILEEDRDRGRRATIAGR
jgi:uncharacterized protein YndB with AHSA1/START domain